MKRYAVGLTGASGVIYGIALIGELLASGAEVHVIVSQAARLVMEQEEGLVPGQTAAQALEAMRSKPGLFFYDNNDITAPMASGLYVIDAMIIMPCTMSTLSALAHGSASS